VGGGLGTGGRGGRIIPRINVFQVHIEAVYTEPVFLNVYGAQESIPRNEFRQPMEPGGPVL
jgi:hypothetical protein